MLLYHKVFMLGTSRPPIVVHPETLFPTRTLHATATAANYLLT